MSLFTPEQLQELNSLVTSRLDSVKSSVDSIKTLIERQTLETKASQSQKEERAEDLTFKQRLEQLETRNRQLEEKDRQSNLHNTAMAKLKSFGINNNSELAMAFLKEGLHYDKLTNQPYLTLDGIPRPLDDAMQLFASSKHGEFLRDPVPANGAGQKQPVNGAVSSSTSSTASDPRKTQDSVEQKLNRGITAKNFLNREEMEQVIHNSMGNDLKI